MVIVDEAYGDYVHEKHSAVNLINRYDNLVVTRTFSKGFGIAKFRVGYGILPEVLSGYYDKIELPFPVSALGAHMATAARPHLPSTCLKGETHDPLFGLRS